MYCIKCGAMLRDGASLCPICSTKVCHPDFPASDEAYTYPKTDFESEAFNRKGILFVISVLALLALVLPVTVELTVSHTLAWSGYVAGGVILAYLFFVLPMWFVNPNPVVFLPVDFAAAILFSLYINLHTGGDWFLSFAFPAGGALGVIFTAVVALFRYVRRGKLYIFGGLLIALGAWILFLEFLMAITFEAVNVVLWALYPCITLTVIGIMLIIIAIVKPFKESLAKMFYI